MKQYDSMFIQKNESGDIYHLCYTDNTSEVISRARFMELSPLTQYEPEDGVYWFRYNYWMFAQTPQDAHRRVVLAYGTQSATIDHDWHTCPDCAACDGVCETCDYRLTVDGMSYRGQ